MYSNLFTFLSLLKEEMLYSLLLLWASRVPGIVPIYRMKERDLSCSKDPCPRSRDKQKEKVG